MTDPTDSVLAVDLPAHALLARHRSGGAFTDCHVVDLPRRVTQAAFVEAFLTTPLFGLERRLIAVLARRPSTDAQAGRLAAGGADDRPFAAWTVEARTERQLLLRDVSGRTRTWLMTEPLGDGGTRLYLGSAVLPSGVDAAGRPSMGRMFRALRRIHTVYARALLGAARTRLIRGVGVGATAPSPGPATDVPADVLAAGPAAPAPPATPARSTRPARSAHTARLAHSAASAHSAVSPASASGNQREAPTPRRAGPPYRARPTPEQIAAMQPFEALPLERIVLIESTAAAEAALRVLRHARFVGFDTESKPTFTREAVSDGPHLIQFATPDQAFLVQVNERAPIDFLCAALDTEDIVKVGFGLDSDRGPLENRLRLRLRGTVELSRLLRRLGHRDALGAKAAVAVVLGRRLQKSKRVQTSNWGAAVLTTQQIVYAANDAYAALKVFEAMGTAQPDR